MSSSTYVDPSCAGHMREDDSGEQQTQKKTHRARMRHKKAKLEKANSKKQHE
jgi:hypothetical protein